MIDFRKLYVFTSLLFFAGAVSAKAALTFELTTGDTTTNAQSLLFSHNKCPVEGPTAAYVAGKLTNTGASAVNNVQATIAGLSGGFALTGSQTTTVNVGSLAAGQEIMIGWLITFPCIDASSANIAISVSDGSSGADTDNITLTTREAKAAAAGGNVNSTTLGAGAVVGQTITADVQYGFGNIDVGNEFVVQPAGNTDFDAACLQLIGSEVLSSNISAISAGTLNDLYFVSPAKQTGTGYLATFRYYYRYLCVGVTTTGRPYAGQTSGGSNIKYSGNYDGGTGVAFNYPTSTNPFILAKSATPTPLLFGEGPFTVTYSVTVQNPSAYDTVLNAIFDTLPAGVAFDAISAASDVTAANSSAVPSNGGTGGLTFSGLFGTSYSLTAGATLALVYTTTVQDVLGSYVNSATVGIGSETLGPATSTVTVASPDLAVTKSASVYDPSAAGLLMVPGNDVVYTIAVQNTGLFTADANSLVLIDIMPSEIEFYNGDFDSLIAGMGPFEFNAGTSSLTCCAAGDVDYSDTVSPPAIFGYPPSAGYDGAVTYLQLKPKGSLQPGEQFSISFRARIE